MDRKGFFSVIGAIVAAPFLKEEPKPNSLPRGVRAVTVEDVEDFVRKECARLINQSVKLGSTVTIKGESLMLLLKKNANQ